MLARRNKAARWRPYFILDRRSVPVQIPHDRERRDQQPANVRHRYPNSSNIGQATQVRVDRFAGSISTRSSMLRNAIAVLAIILVLGSSGLSTSAFARGAGYGGGGGFHGNHFGGGFGDTPGDGHGGYGDRASGLRGGFRGYG